MNPFRGRHFHGTLILWAVRWYCKYGISYRELQEMLAERGVSVDHTTIYRRVQRCAPEMEKRLRWYWRHPVGWRSWCLDETCIKISGKWFYLYRATDNLGHTIDFYLSPRRNTKAACRFLSKTLKNLKSWEIPVTLNTDKSPTCASALFQLKQEGKCPANVTQRQVKYLNNIIECDHGKLKRIINPMLGFKSRRPACATIKGIKTLRALRKGQAAPWYYGHPQGEVRLVNRVFGL